MDIETKMIPIDSIVIKDRVRKDLGDIGKLAESIKELRQLQPIVVDQENNLIFGERRIEACKKLGHTEIRAEVVTHLQDALARYKAEKAENECRKEFSPVEMVAAGRRLEPFEKASAHERQVVAAKAAARARTRNAKGHLVKAGPGPVLGTGPGPTREDRARSRVADTLGTSGTSYQRAKAVIVAAEKHPEIRPIVDKMNATGNIHGAYNEMRKALNRLPGSAAVVDEEKARKAAMNKRIDQTIREAEEVKARLREEAPSAESHSVLAGQVLTPRIVQLIEFLSNRELLLEIIRRAQCALSRLEENSHAGM